VKSACANTGATGAPRTRRNAMIATRFTHRLALCSAATLLAGATLLAQNPGGSPGMPQQQPQQPTTQPTTPSQQPEAGPSSSVQSMADQSFVSEAMQGNMAEVQLAQMAQQKSQSQDVKQFAQKLANDHTQMNQKWFDPVAKQLNVSEPKSPSKKDRKLMAKLEALNGDEFDKEYIAAMVKDHQDDLKKFKQEADGTQDANLKQIATQGSTVISQHLQLAEQVAKNHNIPVEGGEISSR
jgi:putative membrane protein